MSEVGDVSGGPPGEENILEDLLHQHEDNMFDEEPAKKEEEEEKEDDQASGNPAAVESIGNDEHSDISDEESSHSDCDDDDNPRNGKNSPAKSDGGSGRSDISEDEENIGNDEDNKEPEIKEEKKPVPKREKITAPEKSDDEEEETKTSSVQTKKKGKSYDYATKLNYLFREARFFLVKSNNAENVVLAKAKGVWSTPPANEGRFNQAFSEARNVLLVYSVKESGKFTGMARLAAASRRDGPQVSWVLPAGMSIHNGILTLLVI